MPIGMQVFDSSGRLIIDVTTRLSRVISSTVISAGSTGSLSVPNSGEGSIWYALYTTNGNRYAPVISVSGSTISWSPRTGFPGGAIDVTMLYGLY